MPPLGMHVACTQTQTDGQVENDVSAAHRIGGGDILIVSP